MNQSLLIIYTGGTIGMREDPRSGALMPLDFEHIAEQVPELDRFQARIDVQAFEHPLDSSNVGISDWQHIARIITREYERYDGFVVLHGTDTMAYTASALSFMLQDLGKPVVLTGSQLPIGRRRTDGKENLITSVEIALARSGGEPMVREVAVCFHSCLFRGNRIHKYSTEEFDAFRSPNLPALAEIGIHIQYREDLLLRPAGGFRLREQMDNRVGILKIFPGISPSLVEGFLFHGGLRGVILETYGSGNAPTDGWLLDALSRAVEAGMLIVNVSQCAEGFVEQGRYETSSGLARIGVTGGADMTSEAALTKLMFLLAQDDLAQDIRTLMTHSLRGELSIQTPRGD